MPTPTITPGQAIVLGLIQGLTEFIPVSSSAHLNIAHWLFGQDRKLAFDVILHIGTLLALAWTFRHDWVGLLRNPKKRQLRNFVFIACVPGALAGAALRHLEDHPPLSQVWFNAVMLIIAGLVLGYADSVGKKTRGVRQLTWRDALVIGGSQALALIPGVSRSGATITAGLFSGLDREAAARFSFLMALPITLGAVLFEGFNTMKDGGTAALGATMPVMLLGVAISFFSGAWAINFLLKYLKTRDVKPFVMWRAAVGTIVLLAVFALHH